MSNILLIGDIIPLCVINALRNYSFFVIIIGLVVRCVNCVRSGIYYVSIADSVEPEAGSDIYRYTILLVYSCVKLNQYARISREKSKYKDDWTSGGKNASGVVDDSLVSFVVFFSYCFFGLIFPNYTIFSIYFQKLSLKIALA